ncbi:hypothetical protein [Bacillus sp. UNC438CL73TsuS30]|uniref:hypothetical protein n=1 Tax=Bacillus sp. UNC438CL73TsuS30 TaxID=1340434 RepID=UPI00047CBBA6|nr:hypothetical protein [Bacillus sp. UNC438CL73TsuS30]
MIITQESSNQHTNGRTRTIQVPEAALRCKNNHTQPPNSHLAKGTKEKTRTRKKRQTTVAASYTSEKELNMTAKQAKTNRNLEKEKKDRRSQSKKKTKKKIKKTCKRTQNMRYKSIRFKAVAMYPATT